MGIKEEIKAKQKEAAEIQRELKEAAKERTEAEKKLKDVQRKMPKQHGGLFGFMP